VDMKKFDFDLEMPLEKATTEDGRWILKGVAAGTGIDLQNERLSPELVTKFAAQIAQQPVPFLNWHNKNDALAEMGEVVKAWVTPNFDLGVEVELDQDDYRAQKLWRKLDTVNPRTGKPYQYGMSVFGKVHDYKDEYEKSAGRVRTFYDATLEEVSLTTKPIYTPSFGTVLKKAADAASEGDMSEQDTPNVTDEKVAEEKSVESAKEAAASGQETSEPEVTTAEDKVVEKALSSRTKEDAKKIRELVGMHRKMSSLIAELVLSDDEGATDTASAESSEKVVTKSEDTQTVASDILEKAASEIAGLRAEINELRERIPATPAPDVLVKKAEEQEFSELMKSMSPSDKLRFGLRLAEETKKR